MKRSLDHFSPISRAARTPGATLHRMPGIGQIAVAALILLSCMFCNHHAVAGQNIRILTMNLAVDPGFRKKDHWEQVAKDTVQAVSNIYERHFGIRIQLLHQIEWNPPPDATTSDALLYDLRDKVTQRDADVLIGFYDQKLSDPFAGKAGPLGSIAVVVTAFDQSSASRLNRETLLSHELAHLFGVFHPRSHIRSVMNGDGADVIDSQTSQVMRLMRDKDFSKGELAILDLDETRIHAYLKIWSEGHNPDDPNPVAAILTAAGANLARAKHLDEAVDVLRRSIAVDDHIPGSHAALADIYLQQNKADLALQEYKREAAIAPSNSDILVNIAVAQDNLGNEAEARSAFTAAVKANPKLAEAHYNLGLSDLKDGQSAIAEKEFREAIRLNPKFVPAYSDLGVALAMQKRYDESIKVLRAAIEIDPNDIKSHANLGYTLALTGDWNGAIAEYQATLKLDPDNTPTKINLRNALSQVSKTTNQ